MVVFTYNKIQISKIHENKIKNENNSTEEKILNQIYNKH